MGICILNAVVVEDGDGGGGTVEELLLITVQMGLLLSLLLMDRYDGNEDRLASFLERL